MSRLAIVIVSFNARTDLARALTSLHEHPPAVPHHIVVVDNQSGDGTAQMAREQFPAVEIIDAGGNLGFARANNLGIKATTSEFVLLLNPDTVVPDGAVDALVGVLDARADVAAVGPRLVDGEGRAELSFGDMYSPWFEAGRNAVLALDARGLPMARSYIERVTRETRAVDWVSGACLLVRRGAGEAAGWLDERYFMYAEDVDFCAALRAHGGAVLFAPVTDVVHLRGRSGRLNPGATRQAWRDSHLAFYRKHLPRWAPVLEWYLRLTA